MPTVVPVMPPDDRQRYDCRGEDGGAMPPREFFRG